MVPGVVPFTCLDPKLFESAIDRTLRQAGIDKAAFAATFGPVVDPAVAARLKADLARHRILLSKVIPSADPR